MASTVIGDDGLSVFGPFLSPWVVADTLSAPWAVWSSSAILFIRIPSGYERSLRKTATRRYSSLRLFPFMKYRHRKWTSIFFHDFDINLRILVTLRRKRQAQRESC